MPLNVFDKIPIELCYIIGTYLTPGDKFFIGLTCRSPPLLSLDTSIEFPNRSETSASKTLMHWTLFYKSRYVNEQMFLGCVERNDVGGMTYLHRRGVDAHRHSYKVSMLNDFTKSYNWLVDHDYELNEGVIQALIIKKQHAAARSLIYSQLTKCLPLCYEFAWK